MAEDRVLGFEIEDIRSLLDLLAGMPGDAAGRKKIARAYLAVVACRMAKLRRFGAGLERTAAPGGEATIGDLMRALTDPSPPRDLVRRRYVDDGDDTPGQVRLPWIAASLERRDLHIVCATRQLSTRLD